MAAVGLPLLAALLAAPEAVFSAAVTALLAGAAFELLRAAAPEAGPAAALSAAAVAALIVASARAVDAFAPWTLLPVTALAALLILRRAADRPLPAGAWWVLAVLYPGALGAHWVLLRDVASGAQWVAAALVITFATDTGAYAAGRLLGRHRMAPALSPGKTWEGAAGGMLAGAGAGLAAPALLGLSPGATAVAAIALAVPVAAQAGDLLESALKRRMGVKDMSNVVPGHGGLLDRLDSLLLAGPLLYWLLRWLAT